MFILLNNYVFLCVLVISSTHLIVEFALWIQSIRILFDNNFVSFFKSRIFNISHSVSAVMQWATILKYPNTDTSTRSTANFSLLYTIIRMEVLFPFHT